MPQRHRQLPAEEQPGPMQPRFDRRHRQPQRVTDVAIRQLFEITQHQHSLTQRGQQLDGLAQALLELRVRQALLQVSRPIHHGPHQVMAILAQLG